MREISYRDALREAMREEMTRDENVFLLGEDIADPFGGTYKVTLGLSSEFGTERVRNTPISESAIIGASLGAALRGMRPVAELMYIDFTAVCMDQLVNQVAKIRYMSGGQAKVPLVVRTQGGAGRSSAAQHAQSLEAWFLHAPGLKVVMPSTPYDAKGMLKAAIRDDNPVLFIEHKLLYPLGGAVPEDDYLVPLGSAEVRRHGSDVTVVSYSRMVHRALAAAERLAGRGVSAEVIDLRSIVPIDEETVLNSVRKTGRAVIAHEACERGGVGAELAALIAREAFDSLDAPIERVCAYNVPVPFAPRLESFVIPDENRIAQAIARVVGLN